MVQVHSHRGVGIIFLRSEKKKKNLDQGDYDTMNLDVSLCKPLQVHTQASITKGQCSDITTPSLVLLHVPVCHYNL